MKQVFTAVDAVMAAAENIWVGARADIRALVWAAIVCTAY